MRLRYVPTAKRTDLRHWLAPLCRSRRDAGAERYVAMRTLRVIGDVLLYLAALAVLAFLVLSAVMWNAHSGGFGG